MGFWHSKVQKPDGIDAYKTEKEVIRYLDRPWYKYNEQRLKNLVIMSIAKNNDACAINTLRYMHNLPVHVSCEMTQEDLKEMEMYKFVFMRLGISIEDTYEQNLKTIFDGYAQNQMHAPKPLDNFERYDGAYASYGQCYMPMLDNYGIREYNIPKWKTVPMSDVENIVQKYVDEHCDEFLDENVLDNMKTSRYLREEQFRKFISFYNGIYVPRYNSGKLLGEQIPFNGITFPQFDSSFCKLVLHMSSPPKLCLSNNKQHS